MPLEKNKFALILLGASEFPNSTQIEGNIAFLNAKTRISLYFRDDRDLSIDESNVLDLFDRPEGPDDQDKQISKFINDKRANGIKDLFIYYVGHGGITPKEKSFFVAIRSTRDSNLGISSITLASLSETISKAASEIRTFLILDCCFAAQAGRSFQSSTNPVTLQLLEDVPSKGLALLCSSSQSLPSIVINERKITMFTEAFEQAVKTGDSSINNKYLTLRQIHRLTYSIIKQLNPEDGVRPEVLSPIQPFGDVADLAHFKNYAYHDAVADIVAQSREIESQIVLNNLITASKLLIDFVRNFDIHRTHNRSSIMIGSQSSQLETDKGLIQREEYLEKRTTIYTQMLDIIDALLNQKVN